MLKKYRTRLLQIMALTGFSLLFAGTEGGHGCGGTASGSLATTCQKYQENVSQDVCNSFASANGCTTPPAFSPLTGDCTASNCTHCP